MTEREHSDKKVKWKTAWRITGVFNSGVFILVGSTALEKIDQLPDSIESVARLAIITGTAFGTADGLVDFIIGMHHYLGVKTWQALTRSTEKKIKIQKEIDYYKSLRDLPYGSSKIDNSS